MNSKYCKDCDDYRPVSAFSKNARNKDGLAFYCRDHLAERSLRSREARRTKPRVQRRPPEGLVVAEGHKWCPDCDAVLRIEEFARNVASKSGYGSYCKPCHNARGKRALEKVGGARTYHLTRRYGITAAEADHILRTQDGLCAICRSAPANHVDHDHSTGAVRALLCFNCNGGLGQFRDDPDVLRAAAEYVQFHSLRQRVLAAAAAAGLGSVRALRPGEPPVGSQRRPEAPRTSRRSTGRTSGSRRREQAGEADE
ncbi:endonuclease VII domain-containing protein [Candidatus Blastococcus massiliensis]|uniref:endonuclease VII domain-containing protein n=1 Tax=Candidatus Blastococcus massiliensis TaxID=1470358 RepID=UPI0009DF8DB3|nr:endonuclease VII domain-containing protein [Candidatus Blastococcus massiliensis]